MEHASIGTFLLGTYGHPHVAGPAQVRNGMFPSFLPGPGSSFVPQATAAQTLLPRFSGCILLGSA